MLKLSYIINKALEDETFLHQIVSCLENSEMCEKGGIINIFLTMTKSFLLRFK